MLYIGEGIGDSVCENLALALRPNCLILVNNTNRGTMKDAYST